MGGNLIVVHGDDPNTAAIDGAHGEIIWKTNIDGQAAVLFASYGSYGPENILGNNNYASNAAYLITGFTIAIEGCMNPGYMEYDASANVDNGSCSALFSEAYANALSDIAREIGVPAITLAVAWVARNPAITAPILSASDSKQLKLSLDAIDFQMDNSLYNRLSALLSLIHI